MLTKSDLASFRQCPRRLWLERHAPERAGAADASWRRARDGALVGERARAALGPDILWPRSQSSPEEAARSALELLAAAPDKPAVEVPLLREDLYARADALIPTDSGYVLQETKSSSFPLKQDKLTPDEPKPHLLDDLAIQLWVIAASGLKLARAELNLINNRWRYPGDGDYSGLFRPWASKDDAIASRVAQVPDWLAQARQVLVGAMPEVATGKQCEKPHGCPFLEHCQTLDPPAPEHPLGMLPGTAGKSLAKKLRAKGYESLLEPEPAEFTGKDAAVYRRMQRAHRSGEAVLEPDSGARLSALPWPRYYFDFEGIDLPVPHWPGVRPYEQVPFQWSCHIEHEPGRFEHHEFLDLTGEDPSLGCIDALLRAIPPDGDGPIFVYHQQYEAGRLRELGERHPEHDAALKRLIARLVDLLPIVQANYYHPAMRGSFSIKQVLPTIAPDLDYGDLGAVGSGTAAQDAYIRAVFDPATTDERREQYRKDLLRYCKQDTWAMVVLAYHLQRLTLAPR